MAFNVIERWQKLPRPARKAIIILVALAAAAFAPEIIPLLDIGGIELILLVVISYYKPIARFLCRQFYRCKHICSCWHIAFMGSTLAQPKVFMASATIALAFVLITGSIIPFYGFWLPSFFPHAFT